MLHLLQDRVGSRLTNMSRTRNAESERQGLLTPTEARTTVVEGVRVIDTMNEPET